MRRCDRMDHHLVDAETVGQRTHLLGGLRRGADDRASEPRVDDRLLGRVLGLGVGQLLGVWEG